MNIQFFKKDYIIKLEGVNLFCCMGILKENPITTKDKVFCHKLICN